MMADDDGDGCVFRPVEFVPLNADASANCCSTSSSSTTAVAADNNTNAKKKHSSSVCSDDTVPLPLEGKIVVVPILSVGNIGQMAVDLVVETAAATRIGTLSHRFVLPAVGIGAYSHHLGLCHAVEVYAVPGTRVVVVQQRSPAAPGCQEEFARDLVDWVARAGAAHLIMIGSLDATMRTDEELQDAYQMRYKVLHSVVVGEEGECREDQGGEGMVAAAGGHVAGGGGDVFVNNVEEYGLRCLVGERWEEARAREACHMPWALLDAAEQCTVPSMALLAFAVEGDNVREAEEMVCALKATIGEELPLSRDSLRAPPSWASASVRHRTPSYLLV